VGHRHRPHGDWEFAGHAFPGRPRVWLKYAGHNQKPALTQQAKKQGVRIENHLPLSISSFARPGGRSPGIERGIRHTRVEGYPGQEHYPGHRQRQPHLPVLCQPGLDVQHRPVPSCTGGAQSMAFARGPSW